jgi:hypothetical protein
LARLLCYTQQATVVTGGIREVAIRGALGSGETLMCGFPTVRDIGGNPLSTKKMIDRDKMPSPRIYPSSLPISQTLGRFDYRAVQAVPTNPGNSMDY